MFTEELETLKQVLEANISLLSSNVEIIERGKDQRIKGITDDIRDYAYIDYQEGGEQIELERFEGAKNTYLAVGRFKLIARIEGLTSTSAIDWIFACMNTDRCSSITVEAITQDSNVIFMAEAEAAGIDVEGITCDLSLYRFDFIITKTAYSSKVCVDITCKDNTC